MTNLLDTEIGKMPKMKAVIPDDMPDRFSSIVIELNTDEKILEDASKKVQLVYTVQVTSKLAPKKYQEKIFKVYHNWGTQVVSGSQMSLALYQFDTLGFRTPRDIVGKHVIFEKIPLKDAPDYTPPTGDFEGEKYPRYYPVEVVS